MKTRSGITLIHFLAILCTALTFPALSIAALAQAAGAGSVEGPVPPAIPAAKAIFLSNGGADSGLFPEPFKGDPNRPYAQFYTALKDTGQFKLVDDPSDADLVLELRLSAPYGPSRGSKQYGAADPLPMFRLVIYDRKSHYVLWTLTQSVQLAFQQKTHDRNFDDALKILLDDFLKVAGKHTPQSR